MGTEELNRQGSARGSGDVEPCLGVEPAHLCPKRSLRGLGDELVVATDGVRPGDGCKVVTVHVAAYGLRLDIDALRQESPEQVGFCRRRVIAGDSEHGVDQIVRTSEPRGDLLRRTKALRVGSLGEHGYEQTSVDGFDPLGLIRKHGSDRGGSLVFVCPGGCVAEQIGKVERLIESVTPRAAHQSGEHAHQVGLRPLEGPCAASSGD